MAHQIQEPTDYTLDSIKRSLSRVFWGNVPGHEDGSGKMSQSEVRTDFQTRLSEKDYADEQHRRKVTIRINFLGVTIDELLTLESGSTTIYKMWYNNAGVATWTENDVETFLLERVKKGFHEVNARDVLDGRTKRVASPATARKKLVAALQNATPDQRKAILADLQKELGL